LPNNLSKSDYIVRLDRVRKRLHQFSLRPEDFLLDDLLHDPATPTVEQIEQRLLEHHNFEEAAYTAKDIASSLLDTLNNSLLPSLTEDDVITTTTYPRLFVSYSHQDAKFLEQLQIHLTPYTRNETVEYWVDNKIPSGANWKETIFAALKQASFGLLLVSPDFLASDFVFKHELPQLLQKRVLWVSIRSSSYDQTQISVYQALNQPNKPLSGMTKAQRDAAWVNICRSIQAALPGP